MTPALAEAAGVLSSSTPTTQPRQQLLISTTSSPSTQNKLLQNNHHDRRYHHHRRDTHLSHPQLGAPRQLGEAPPAPSGRPGSEEQTHSVGYKHCSVRVIYSKYNPALDNLSIHPSIRTHPTPQANISQKAKVNPLTPTQRPPSQSPRARTPACNRQPEERPPAPPRPRGARRAQHPTRLDGCTGAAGPSEGAGEEHAG